MGIDFGIAPFLEVKYKQPFLFAGFALYLYP